MQWFNPLLFITGLSAVSAIALPAPVEKRDANQAVADLYAISNATAALTKQVNALQPGLFSTVGALGVLPTAGNLNNLIQKAKTNAQRSAPYDEAGSFNIAGVTFQLQDQVKASIDALVAKRQILGSVLFGTGKVIVKGTIAKLRQSTKDLGSAIVPKLSSDLQSVAPEVLAEIDAEFARGLAAYQ